MGGRAFATVVTVALALPAAAGAAGTEFRSSCWYGKTQGVDAYRWPFNNTKDPEYAQYKKDHNGLPLPGNSPTCRVTPGGMKDKTPPNVVEIGIETSTLRANGKKGVVWPLLDSLGGPFAEIRMLGPNRWMVKRLSDGAEWPVGRTDILVKGRICMRFAKGSPFKLSEWSFVHVRFGPKEGVPAGVDLSFGGLIDRRALPASAQPRSASAGCGRSSSRPPGPPRPIGPFFDLAPAERRPMYVSEGAFGRRIFQGEDVRNYLDDTFNMAALVVSTTAVDGGGIVRAIVPQGTAFEPADAFGYPDQNYACKSSHGVTWHYGRIGLGKGRAWGWVPRYTAVAPYDKVPEITKPGEDWKLTPC